MEGVKFRRQYLVGKYIVDFISVDKKIIIELDGGQHNEERVIESDTQRTKYLEGEKYSVLRFWNNEILENLEGVLEAIKNKIILPSP